MSNSGPLNVERWKSGTTKSLCDGCNQIKAKTYMLKNAGAYPIRLCYSCSVKLDSGVLKLTEPGN